MSNWEQMLATHPEREGGKEVSVFNTEYRQRQRGELYPPTSGIIATSDQIHFAVINRCTDAYEENLSADQVEAAMVRLNVANSSWGCYDPFPLRVWKPVLQ